MGCNTLVATEVIQCAANGKTQSVLKTCDAGNRCAGQGACVSEGNFDVSDGVNALQAAAAGLSNGAIAIGWVEADASVHVRVLDGGGKPVGPSSAIQDAFTAKTDERIAIAAVGTGFAVAWVAAANSGDVVVRFFGDDGVPGGDASVIHTVTTGVQFQVALAGNDTGAVVAWSADVNDGLDKDIMLQRYDAAGQQVGAAVVVNAQTGINDIPTALDQSEPALALRDDGAIAVTWTHEQSKTYKQRVRARLLDAAGKPLSGVITLGDNTGVQRDASIVFDGDVLTIVWMTTNSGTGQDILLRRFQGDTLSAAGGAITVNTITAGNQTSPRIFAAADGRLLILWSSQNAVSATSGSDVAARERLTSGQLSNETTVHASGNGEQDLPSAAAFADGRIVDVWRHRDSAGAAGIVRARFR